MPLGPPLEECMHRREIITACAQVKMVDGSPAQHCFEFALPRVPQALIAFAQSWSGWIDRYLLASFRILETDPPTTGEFLFIRIADLHSDKIVFHAGHPNRLVHLLHRHLKI